jgi:hypothetical protein
LTAYPRPVTEAEARLRCQELNSELGDGDVPWTVREVESGDWRPARARIPGLPARERYKATTEAKPKPPQADDPRDASQRNVPPYGAGF